MGPTPSENIAKKLGARIQKLRTAQNIPTDIMAESAGMTVEDYEAGERGDRLFQAAEIHFIARTLGINSSEILSAL